MSNKTSLSQDKSKYSVFTLTEDLFPFPILFSSSSNYPKKYSKCYLLSTSHYSPMDGNIRCRICSRRVCGVLVWVLWRSLNMQVKNKFMTMKISYPLFPYLFGTRVSFFLRKTCYKTVTIFTRKFIFPFVKFVVKLPLDNAERDSSEICCHPGR